MIDPVIEDAVHAIRDRVGDLRQALDSGNEDTQETASEGVCLAVRFAMALFLPAWVEAGCHSDEELTDQLKESVDEALDVLPGNTPYFESVAKRRKQLEEFLTGKKTALVY